MGVIKTFAFSHLFITISQNLDVLSARIFYPVFPHMVLSGQGRACLSLERGTSVTEFQGLWLPPQRSTLTLRPLQGRCSRCAGGVAFQHFEIEEGDTG